jgi:hypothetical protein
MLQETVVTVAVTAAVDILEHQEVGIEHVAVALLTAVMVMTIEVMEAEAIAIMIAHMVTIKDIEGKTNRTIDKIAGKILDIFHTKLFDEIMRIFTGITLIVECMLFLFLLRVIKIAYDDVDLR